MTDFVDFIDVCIAFVCRTGDSVRSTGQAEHALSVRLGQPRNYRPRRRLMRAL